MLNGPFSPWPSFTLEEAQRVNNILLSNRVNYWTGNEGKRFETEFADWADARHAIAVSNGTVALDLALAALGVGQSNGGSAEDEVIVTPRTFIASVSSVVNSNARPVFAEIDRDSGNITAETIKAVLTPRTKAVVLVHLAGWPCEMDPIMQLAEEHGLKVIEDCAQAHGASYRGRSVGSIGHVGAWSFCQDKIMTTGGEGGMITTNDTSLWKRLWAYKEHGKSWDLVHKAEHPPGFRWLHESFGTNARMTEMQAGIGRIQLERMPGWNDARANNAQIITDALAPFSGSDGAVRTPLVPDHMEHALYKYYAYVRPENLASGWDRDRIVDEVSARGVPCMQGSCSEVYLEKAFEGTGLRPEDRLPAAKELGETSLMLLVHPTLTADEMTKTANVLKEVLTLASGK